MDSMLSFYWDLYGHCDGTIRELICNKLSTLLKSTLQDTVQGNDKKRDARDEEEQGKVGLIGGDEVVKNRIKFG